MYFSTTSFALTRHYQTLRLHRLPGVTIQKDSKNLCYLLPKFRLIVTKHLAVWVVIGRVFCVHFTLDKPHKRCYTTVGEIFAPLFRIHFFFPIFTLHYLIKAPFERSCLRSRLRIGFFHNPPSGAKTAPATPLWQGRQDARFGIFLAPLVKGGMSR